MNIFTILLAILVFGLLIFVHELGHFLAAKWAKIRVLEFAMGMGPTLWSVTKGGTKYALRLFPIGGFVAMDEDNGESDDENAFCNAPLHKRIIAIVAGAVMNLLLGVIILTFLSARLPLLGTTQVADFAADAVSSQQLQVGDTILKVNGHRVRSDNDLKYELMRVREENVEMVVDRPGMDGPVTISVPFRMSEVEGSNAKIIYFDFRIYGVKPTPLGVAQNALNWTASYAKMVWGSVVDLITGRFGFNDLSGPVGVTQAIGEASSAGIEPFLSFVAFITVNLGVFNLLPLPALDGGRLLFLFAELIRRKPVNPKYEGYVHMAGFALLILLMITVTFSDLVKIFTPS